MSSRSDVEHRSDERKHKGDELNVAEKSNKGAHELKNYKLKVIYIHIYIKLCV